MHKIIRKVLSLMPVDVDLYGGRKRKYILQLTNLISKPKANIKFTESDQIEYDLQFTGERLFYYAFDNITKYYKKSDLYKTMLKYLNGGGGRNQYSLILEQT